MENCTSLLGLLNLIDLSSPKYRIRNKYRISLVISAQLACKVAACSQLWPWRHFCEGSCEQGSTLHHNTLSASRLFADKVLLTILWAVCNLRINYIKTLLSILNLCQSLL